MRLMALSNRIAVGGKKLAGDPHVMLSPARRKNGLEMNEDVNYNNSIVRQLTQGRSHEIMPRANALQAPLN